MVHRKPPAGVLPAGGVSLFTSLPFMTAIYTVPAVFVAGNTSKISPTAILELATELP